MITASVGKKSDKLIVDYAGRYGALQQVPEVTERCRLHCIQTFENIQTAARLEKNGTLKIKGFLANQNVAEPSKELLDAIQTMFFEMYDLEIHLEQDSCEFRWTEADLGKIYPQRPSLVSPENQNPAYRRQKMDEVTEASINPPVEIDQPPKGITFYAKGAIVYSWNAEGVRDHGWGCAWRAIQTCLSSYGTKITFKELFHKFGSMENLKALYRSKYSEEFLKSTKPFAPHDTTQGWAEPFIGEMVLHYFSIAADLESINGIPKDCNAPHEVFHNLSMTFVHFKERLEKHFKSKKPVPVMIDDGSYSYNIIGIGGMEPHCILWIADPHIKEGSNRHSTNGLYTIALDENGRQVRCSLSAEDQNQKGNMNSAGSYAALYFYQKPWMALFPRTGS